MLKINQSIPLSFHFITCIILKKHHKINFLNLNLQINHTKLLIIKLIQLNLPIHKIITKKT